MRSFVVRVPLLFFPDRRSLVLRSARPYQPGAPAQRVDGLGDLLAALGFAPGVLGVEVDVLAVAVAVHPLVERHRVGEVRLATGALDSVRRAVPVGGRAARLAALASVDVVVRRVGRYGVPAALAWFAGVRLPARGQPGRERLRSHLLLCQGSSPRVRGSRPRRHQPCARAGSIPAAPETMGARFGFRCAKPAAPNRLLGQGNGQRAWRSHHRNRGGRPPLAIEQQRTHAVTVRFTVAEARALKRRAARRSCTDAPLSARTSPARRTPSSCRDRTRAPRPVSRRVELRRVGRLLDDAVRAVNALPEGAPPRDARPAAPDGRRGRARAREVAVIGRVIGSGRGIKGMVSYITHDQTSPDNRRPTTSERVAWFACLGIPTTDTDLMVRVMQGLTANAPALKAMAGISARGRKLKRPYTHIVLSCPEGTEAPPRQDMLSAVGGALKSIRLDVRHYAVCAAHTDTARPHVHVAVSLRRPRDGPGGEPRRGRHEASQPVGGAVRARPPGDRRAHARRTAQGAGGPTGHQAPLPQGRPAARASPLDRRAAALAAAGEASPQTAALIRRVHAGPARAVDATGRTPARRGAASADCQDERVAHRRREWRTYQGARAEAHSARGPAPFPPRSASNRKLRADGARPRIELRRGHRTERASLAHRLGRAAVRALRRGAAAARELFRQHRPEVDVEAARGQLEADRRQSEADLADARRRRAWQTHDRLSKAATRTGIAHEHANDDLQYQERRRRASRDERTPRRDAAAHEAWNATRHARHRFELRLLVYENAARAVGLDLSRRSSKAPYSPSLEQLVAEADRQVARESRKPDRHQSRPEAPPMTPTRPAVRPARPHPATDAPSTGYGVDSSGNRSPSGPRRTSPGPAP